MSREVIKSYETWFAKLKVGSTVSLVDDVGEREIKKISAVFPGGITTSKFSTLGKAVQIDDCVFDVRRTDLNGTLLMLDDLTKEDRDNYEGSEIADFLVGYGSSWYDITTDKLRQIFKLATGKDWESED